MCCCNCEAIDSLCTSILCCGNNDSGYINVVKHSSCVNNYRVGLFFQSINDISDRLRYPYFGGARKVNMDFFISLFAVFLYVYVGTFNFICSILTIMLIPILLYTRFFMLRLSMSKSSTSSASNSSSTTILKDLTTQKKKDPINRMKIAFFMTFNSFSSMLIIFNFNLHEELTTLMSDYYKNMFSLAILFAIALHFCIHLSNPGFMKKYEPDTKKESTTSQSLRSYRDENYCHKCNLRRSQNGTIGHCTVCQNCVLNRDHHCFWVDNCIGYLNHKLFLFYLIYLLLLFLCSFYLVVSRLSELDCKLFSLDKDNTKSCLFDVYYSNSNRAFLTISFFQLIPLISYLTVLIIQQSIFVGLGLTQYQLHKRSQQDIRFSLILFIGSNLSLNKFFKNCFQFLKIRTRKDLVNKQSVLQDYHI